MLPDLSPVLVISGLVWFTAEIVKYSIGRLHDRDRKFMDSGGMPSVHTAVIVGATTSIVLTEGIDSSLFGLGVVVSAIVMHDAVRVRWAVGEQAVRINQLSQGRKLARLPVFRGHRIREVAAGAAYGTVLATILYQLLYS
ncbi:MAG: divergent PAP2 family protein [bacterium]|nr:divergent PAP2 family protein [bacterium]